MGHLNPSPRPQIPKWSKGPLRPFIGSNPWWRNLLKLDSEIPPWVRRPFVEVCLTAPSAQRSVSTVHPGRQNVQKPESIKEGLRLKEWLWSVIHTQVPGVRTQFRRDPGLSVGKTEPRCESTIGVLCTRRRRSKFPRREGSWLRRRVFYSRGRLGYVETRPPFTSFPTRENMCWCMLLRPRRCGVGDSNTVRPSFVLTHQILTFYTVWVN